MKRTRTKTQSVSAQMRNRSKSRKSRKELAPKKNLFLKTGSTMLNLALTDSINGGWPIGNIATIPGQSAAGKTMLLLHTFAEACLDPVFDYYRLIYDDVERRNDFPIAKLFPPLLDRLETPSGLLYKDLNWENEEESGISRTIQDLKNNMLLLKKAGVPFIYIGDSLDSYASDEEMEKEMKRALASVKTDGAAKKIAGSFNAEKAKILGQILRMINDQIADSNSLFILTQQLRQKMNAMPFESPWTTSGGQAPGFYSHIRTFLTKAGSIKELGRKVGGICKVRTDKNSITGKLRDIEYPIYNELGIDDTASVVEFLLKEKHWKPGSWITAPELDLKENGKDKLIRAIEDKGLEKRVRRIAQKVWNRIEEQLELKRKPRY